jgi:mannose-1-phosphate guanylyltransferase
VPNLPWKVVLAAGAGRRLQSVTGCVPKQFWRRNGEASLLEQTIDRFEPLAPWSRTVVIVDEGHREHIAETARLYPVGTVVVQPQDRGTAAGVLLALTPVLEIRPQAIVIVTP